MPPYKCTYNRRLQYRPISRHYDQYCTSHVDILRFLKLALKFYISPIYYIFFFLSRNFLRELHYFSYMYPYIDTFNIHTSLYCGIKTFTTCIVQYYAHLIIIFYDTTKLCFCFKICIIALWHHYTIALFKKLI